MHHLDDRFDVGNRRLRQNAVAKVENVAGTASGLFENRPYPAFEFGSRGEQGCRIEIPLHGGVWPKLFPAPIERCAPVEANHVAAGVFHQRQKSRRVRAEVNHRNAGRAHFAQNQLRVRQNVFAVIVRTERAHPAIEELNRLRPGVYLRDEVVGDEAGEFGNQRVPRLRVAILQAFGFDVVAQ